MCHHLMRTDEREHHHCGCSCNCPALTSVEDEIQILEDHKTFMQEQVIVIEKKLAALKAAKKP